MTSAACAHQVDHFVARGRRVFAWGWAAHPRDRVTGVSLRLRGRDWDADIPCSPGQARPDVLAGHPELHGAASSGWVMTGYVPGNDVKVATLVIDLEDGLFHEVDVTSRLQRLDKGEPFPVLARRLARGAWRRIRTRDLRGLMHRTRRQQDAPPNLDSPAVLAKLVRTLAPLPPAVIVVDHSLGGGSNLYRRNLVAQRLESGQPVLLFTYRLGTLDHWLEVYLPGAERSIMAIPGTRTLDAILERAAVAEIFVNSLVSFDDPLRLAEWLAEAKTRWPKVRLTITSHDYFAACPSFVLLDADGRFCGLPEMSRCASCLARHRGSFVTFSPPTDMPTWRATWQRTLAVADEVRSFSGATRELMARAFPALPSDRATVVPHDMKYFDSNRPRIDDDAPLVIGIVGEITLQKGAAIVEDMVALIEAGDIPARVVVLGDLQSPRPSPKLTVTGAYRHDQLVRLIEQHGINMFLFPSIWPETFSYVVGELMHLRVPIVAFDLGAPAERLRTYPHGRLVGEVNAAAALETAIAFHAQRSLRGASAA